MHTTDIGQFDAKTLDVKFKTDGLADGEFIGYASIFGNKDSYGDVVEKGAFSRTLAEWQRKGIPIPVYWEHNTADPDFNLGEVLSAVEDERGLKVHARFDMDSPKSAQAYRLLKGGRVNQMSFAYSVVDGAYVQPEGGEGYYALRDLDLYEVSIVPIGANQRTEVIAVKMAARSLLSKAGRTLSMANEEMLRNCLEQLDEARGVIEEVLNSVDSGADSGGKAQDQSSGKEPPPEPKSASGEATPTPSLSLAMAMLEIETLGVTS